MGESPSSQPKGLEQQYSVPALQDFTISIFDGEVLNQFLVTFDSKMISIKSIFSSNFGFINPIQDRGGKKAPYQFFPCNF